MNRKRRNRRRRGAPGGRGRPVAVAESREGKPFASWGRWFEGLPGGAMVAVVCAGLIGFLAFYFAQWQLLFPAVGELVGTGSVGAVLAGWAFGGGAFACVGVVVLYWPVLGPAAREVAQVVAVVWSTLGAVCFPTGVSAEVALPVDFWAGVYAGAYGVAFSPVALPAALGLTRLVRTKLLKRSPADPGSTAVGWVFVGYSVLLLVLGATWLRT